MRSRGRFLRRTGVRQGTRMRYLRKPGKAISVGEPREGKETRSAISRPKKGSRPPGPTRRSSAPAILIRYRYQAPQAVSGEMVWKKMIHKLMRRCRRASGR